MKPAVGVMLTLACAFTSVGCRGILTWATVYESVAPDGGARVEVQEGGCFTDCAVRVVVKRGWRAERIGVWDGCSTVQFSHAAWEGDTVAVFVDGGSCGPIQAAYDVRARRAVEFAAAEPWLRNSIVRSYGVDEFAKRFPRP